MDTEIIRETFLAKILAEKDGHRPESAGARAMIQEAERRLSPKDVFCLRMFMRAAGLAARPQIRHCD